MNHAPHEPTHDTHTITGALWDFAKFLLMIVAGFAAAVLVLLPPALLWPESTLWVISERSGWKTLAAAASFEICLLLGAAAFVFKYVPFIGTALAFMARASVWVFVALLFVSSLPGLVSVPPLTGMGAL